MKTTILIIIIWGRLAALAAGAELIMVYRRLTGKLGERRRAECCMLAAQFGGVRNLVLIVVVLSVLAPPVVLDGCLRTCWQDYLKNRDSQAGSQ